MARKNATIAGEEDMMVGAWQWACDAMAGHETQVTIALAPTEREGVWNVVAREHWCYEGRPLGLRRSVALIWPTSSQQTLPGRIMEAIGMLEQAPVQEVLPWLTKA